MGGGLVEDVVHAVGCRDDDGAPRLVGVAGCRGAHGRLAVGLDHAEATERNYGAQQGRIFGFTHELRVTAELVRGPRVPLPFVETETNSAVRVGGRPMDEV